MSNSPNAPTEQSSQQNDLENTACTARCKGSGGMARGQGDTRRQLPGVFCPEHVGDQAPRNTGLSVG